MFDLLAILSSSVYLLSGVRHSSATEIPLPEELNRAGHCNFTLKKMFSYHFNIYTVLRKSQRENGRQEEYGKCLFDDTLTN